MNALSPAPTAADAPATPARGITPSDLQHRAIRDIVNWYGSPQQEFYLAGYAGVGKTTIATFAIEEIRRRYRKCQRVITGAYTGKAAHRLRQKGAENPSTIHRMIYRVSMENGRLSFKLATDGPASAADLIVLDEVSMVNQTIARDVRSFGKKILVMGDPGQLPPVAGAGAFTNREPDAFLSEIHRQAADSPIIRLATDARLGRRIQSGDYGDDVRALRLNRDTGDEVYLPRTQAICGVHRVRWTIIDRARRRLGFEGPWPAKCERVICCRNNHEEGLFNGALGITTRPTRDPDERGLLSLDVHLEDEDEPRRGLPTHPHLFLQVRNGASRPPRIDKGVNEFDFAYAITCHKAQGSEWPHVTIVDDSAAFRREDRDDSAKWLYTAITRAQTGLTLLLRD